MNNIIEIALKSFWVISGCGIMFYIMYLCLKGNFSKVFICQCNENHGIKNIKQLEGNRIVGRCLKCGKRSYGQFIPCSYTVQKASQGGESDGTR